MDSNVSSQNSSIIDLFCLAHNNFREWSIQSSRKISFYIHSLRFTLNKHKTTSYTFPIIHIIKFFI